jgi:serine/threonine-protein kinase
LIWFLAGHAPALGTHVNTCKQCSTRASSDDVQYALEAVREVPEVRPGAVVGESFIIDEILGAGTFGLVVSATARNSDKRVAIKLLRPRFNQQREVLARFEREAAILAKLRSPRICRSLGSGATSNGTQYLVTEFVRGETLRTKLEKQGQLPLDLAARYMVQICEALGETHANGVVHRDLKPENVMVVESSGDDVIKLLDFGVARALSDVRLTSTGQAMGSPLYMAPEQLMNSKDVGPAADIWAIGVMLQELVTGTSPFLSESIAVVYSRILDGMRDSIVGSGEELEPIIERCLQHHAENRFASVTELAVALAPFAVTPKKAAPPHRATLKAPPAPKAPAPKALPAVNAPSVPQSPQVPADTLPSGTQGVFGAVPHTLRDSGPRHRGGSTSDALSASKTVAAPSRRPWALGAIAVGALVSGAVAIYVAATRRESSSASEVATSLVQTPPAVDAGVTVTPIEPIPPQVPMAVPIDAPAEAPLDAANLAIAGATEVRVKPALGKTLTPAQKKAGLESVRGRTDGCVNVHSPLLKAGARVKTVITVTSEGHVERVDANTGCIRSEGCSDEQRQRKELEECLNVALSSARFVQSSAGAEVFARFDVSDGQGAPVLIEDGGCDEVSCVLNNYEGNCCAKYKKGHRDPFVAKPSSNLPDSLDRAMISTGIAKVKARVSSCGDRSSATGRVKISVRVAPGGAVESTDIKESPDEALAACVQKAVEKATFAKTVNGGSFSYPFVF